MGGEEDSVQAGLRRFYERSEYATLDFAAWAQYCFAEWDGPLLDEALRAALPEGVVFGELAMTLPDDITEEEWLRVGEYIAIMGVASDEPQP